MVCGTASDVGKTHIVVGLCRALARAGVSVAPFKGQNMSNNSMVTAGGAEIGRAQYTQALAARVEAEPAMNPVLLKPNGDRTSQVVVMGTPWRTLDATEYHAAKADLAGLVLDALNDLRGRFEVVLCEGAGSPAEVNLLANDIVNLGLARRAGVPAVIVGDIDRGGVFAHLHGTVGLLPEDLRAMVRGFIINKLRGDPALLGDAIEVLAEMSGLPTFGVLPYLIGVDIDAEDSMALLGAEDGWGEEAYDVSGDSLDVAVMQFPSVSNFTDFDPLRAEPTVRVHFIERPVELMHADLVVLPGSKTTVADLAWMRRRGLADALEARRRSSKPPVVLGICGGYQMLGREIRDPGGVESPAGSVAGLGLLDLVTEFEPTKVTVRRAGVDPAGGRVTGYEIHHGRPRLGDGVLPLFRFAAAEGAAGGELTETEGGRDDRAGVYGTSLHGLFEADEWRADFLQIVAGWRGKKWVPSKFSFAEARELQIDRLADACEEFLDLDALWAVAAGAHPARGPRAGGPPSHP
jgi:adenosylcobyric acid synthase